MRPPKPFALLALLLLPALALGFWGKKTDEERLKDKLDSLKVHLYLAGKAAVTKTAGSDEAKAVLTRFLNAVEARDWEKAWTLLSAPLRSRYTPDRFREDFVREPLATERVRRARLALKGVMKMTHGDATLALGADRAVRLVLEGGEYRVASIE